MRHRYACPTRWADMDQLGHINNVVYVDYLQEARVDMLRAHGPATGTGELPGGTVVVRHEVSYVAPLTYEFKPVLIECWVTEIRAATFTIAYEIFDEDADGDRRVYVRASTVLTPYVFETESPRRISPLEKETLRAFLEPVEREKPVAAGPRPETAVHYPVRVRFSDVDVYGHVNNVKYFEYFQEARISLFSGLWDFGAVTVVVAQTDVDYRIPILFRPEAYDAWSWISRVGERSITVESVICDGATVLAQARVVIVFFDQETQRSTRPPEAYLDKLRTLLAG